MHAEIIITFESDEPETIIDCVKILEALTPYMFNNVHIGYNLNLEEEDDTICGNCGHPAESHSGKYGDDCDDCPAGLCSDSSRR